MMMNVMQMVHLVSFSKSFGTLMRNYLGENSSVVLFKWYFQIVIDPGYGGITCGKQKYLEAKFREQVCTKGKAFPH